MLIVQKFYFSFLMRSCAGSKVVKILNIVINLNVQKKFLMIIWDFMLISLIINFVID